MFRNYLKTAIRNLLRNRKHALLNIAGLGVALGACIVVFLVIRFEYSHNKHLAHYHQLNQVVTRDVDAEGEHFTGGVPFPAAEYLRLDFPQYTFGQFMQNNGAQITVRKPQTGKLPDGKFIESVGVFFAEPEVADLFELTFLAGNQSALKDPNHVVLSRKIAEKYFGSWKNAMGNRLNMDNERFDFTVAGVFEDVPDNCDFPFQILASYMGFVSHNSAGWPLEDWGSNTSNHQVFVRLPENANPDIVNTQLAGFEKKHNSNNRSTTRTHFLHPMADVHFDERFPTTGDHQTTKASLFTLASIGLLILLMACINFVNLSTALAVSRSKEVGVRKVLGSTRSQVRTQVLVETAVLVLAAVFAGAALASLSLPYLKNIMSVQSPLRLFNVETGIYLLLITAVTILLSGLYPAFVMSEFRPVEAIKNKISSSKVGSLSLRRVLVVVQFSFSQIFLIATLVAVSQMDYIQNADLGFRKESVLVLHGNPDSASRARHLVFKNALLARSDVKEVTYSFDAPSSDNSWQSNFAYETTNDRDYSVTLKMGDENYIKTYGLQLVAGRSYGAGDTTREYVVNETFLKKVGVKNPKDAIGKMVRLGGQSFKPICGVVKDFHSQSLRETVPPIILHLNRRFSGTAGVKIAGTNLLKTNEEIHQLWDHYFPEYAWNGEFLDDSINRFYRREQQVSLLYKVYAGLAIFISCLGLYGLISYMVVQKTKEVGIRKLLGASTQSLVLMFSREFMALILLAFVIAGPVAWYFMNLWLQDFAYKVEIGPAVFLLAIFTSGLVAWLTVGYKAVQAAVANPVKNLRAE